MSGSPRGFFFKTEDSCSRKIIEPFLVFVAFRSIRIVEAYWGRFSIRTETELGDNLYHWVARCSSNNSTLIQRV